MARAARYQQMAPGRRGEGLLTPALIFLAVLAAWEALTRLRDIKSYVLPSPSAIVRRLQTDWPTLASNFQVTLSEMLLGFGLAFVVAMTLGILIAHSPAIRRGLYPFVIASQTVPVIAIAPVLIIWFGYNILPRVLVTALLAFFPLTVNTVTGFQAVETELVNLFRSLAATRAQIFFKLSLPAALPFIFAGLKVSATHCVIGATVGEWIGTDRGLGHLIVLDTAQLDTPRVFASIVLLSLSGIALFLAVSVFEWILLPWRHGHAARRPLFPLLSRRVLRSKKAVPAISGKEA
jgi:ABC-type nitrate/sulfonate/bicarbonate transport system permease component